MALVEEASDEIYVMYAGRIVESAPTPVFFNNPNHPYSQALLKSLPVDKGKQLAIIKGQPPSIQQDISGCKFHPRCQYAMQVCPKEVPELKEIEPDHKSACHLNT